MIIYEPRGRAREYAALAANLYRGCSHGCLYCYAPACLHLPAVKFHDDVTARIGVLEQLKKEVSRYRGNPDPILLCFTCDPYQPIEGKQKLTRAAIELFAANDVKFSILTKGGTLAVRDFDVMTDSRCEFGTTLLFIEEKSRVEWEPGASSIEDRIQSIREAHERGIHTYVSLEPVIDPKQALVLIEEIHPIVDFWKVGKLNHHPLAKAIDWTDFLKKATAKLNDVGARYYLKKDLLSFGMEN
jgi:DNA repair photolyase